MYHTVRKMKFHLPLGSHEWTLEADNAHCGHTAGHISRLTFSDCFPNKYTCNSGHCIPLSNKCDTSFDCADKSDEQYCDYLTIGDDYGKELVPRAQNGK